jgi:hypothetical protein
MNKAKRAWWEAVNARPNRPRDRIGPAMYMDQRRFAKVQWLLKHRDLWESWPEDVWRVRHQWPGLVQEMKVDRVVGAATTTDAVCVPHCIAWARDIIDGQNVVQFPGQ